MGRNFKGELLNGFTFHADGVSKQGLLSLGENICGTSLHRLCLLFCYFSNVGRTLWRLRNVHFPVEIFCHIRFTFGEGSFICRYITSFLKRVKCKAIEG